MNSCHTSYQLAYLFLSADLYRKSYDEIRLPNSQPRGPEHQTQDLVVGLAPLKLMQNSPLPLTKDDTVDEHSMGEDEYRSLQLELLKFAEEEGGERKESASFPLTYRRRHEAKRQLHQQIAEKREMISQPHQKEAKEEEGPAWRELQQKVHTLEHVYNQECFLKVYRCNHNYIILL